MKLNLKKYLTPKKIYQKQYFDKRGYFQEIFLKRNFNLNVKFTAIAKSKKNVIRGLHFQKKTNNLNFFIVLRERF